MASIRSESESTFNRAEIILSSIGNPSSSQRFIALVAIIAVFRHVGFMTEKNDLVELLLGYSRREMHLVPRELADIFVPLAVGLRRLEIRVLRVNRLEQLVLQYANDAVE